MVDYFARSSSEICIIAREDILLPDHVPDELLHRDAELATIAEAVKPMINNRYANNMFLHGPSGTGKTSCVKFLLRQLSSASYTVLPVYVNCWEDNTQLAVYNRIIDEMRLPLPRRGLAADELFGKILDYMRSYKKSVLLVLDEMDALRGDDLLYTISRYSDRQGINFGIIGITNDYLLLAKFDARVRSSLRFSSLEFKKYSEEQLFAILKKRAEVALVDGSWDERALHKIASTVEEGNARDCLELLWKAAKSAEKNNHPKIMLQDIADSGEELVFRLSTISLAGSELEIIEILKAGEKESSELYEALKKLKKSKRQIRNYLSLLEKKGIVESVPGKLSGVMASKIYRLNSKYQPGNSYTKPSS
jgi:cell division control protein 6